MMMGFREIYGVYGVIGKTNKRTVEKSTYKPTCSCLRYGVVANIIASHAIARGSIPRVGICLRFSFLVSAPPGL